MKLLALSVDGGEQGRPEYARTPHGASRPCAPPSLPARLSAAPPRSRHDRSFDRPGRGGRGREGSERRRLDARAFQPFPGRLRARSGRSGVGRAGTRDGVGGRPAAPGDPRRELRIPAAAGAPGAAGTRARFRPRSRPVPAREPLYEARGVRRAPGGARRRGREHHRGSRRGARGAGRASGRMGPAPAGEDRSSRIAQAPRRAAPGAAIARPRGGDRPFRDDRPRRRARAPPTARRALVPRRGGALGVRGGDRAHTAPAGGPGRTRGPRRAPAGDRAPR